MWTPPVTTDQKQSLIEDPYGSSSSDEDEDISSSTSSDSSSESEDDEMNISKVRNGILPMNKYPFINNQIYPKDGKHLKFLLLIRQVNKFVKEIVKQLKTQRENKEE